MVGASGGCRLSWPVGMRSPFPGFLINSAPVLSLSNGQARPSCSGLSGIGVVPLVVLGDVSVQCPGARGLQGCYEKHGSMSMDILPNAQSRAYSKPGN